MVVYSVKDFAKWAKGTGDNIKKIHQERTDNTYKCKCGHSVVIRPGLENVLCHWCNHLVFKDKEKQKVYDELTEKREALLKFKKEMRKRIK